MQKNMQIERFTIDNVMETSKLKKMNKNQLIHHIERIEKHALQLDYALETVLKNISKQYSRQTEVDPVTGIRQ